MRKLIIVIALTIGADTVAIAQRPTTDIVGITSVTDGQGSVLDSVLLADGGVKKIVFTLKGSSRKYSACMNGSRRNMRQFLKVCAPSTTLFLTKNSPPSPQ